MSMSSHRECSRGEFSMAITNGHVFHLIGEQEAVSRTRDERVNSFTSLLDDTVIISDVSDKSDDTGTFRTIVIELATVTTGGE